MFHKNLSYAIHTRTNNTFEQIGKDVDLCPRYICRLRANKQRISKKNLKDVFKLAKYLDINPADLLLMKFSDFIKTYSDTEIKTYIDLRDNFLFNVNLFMNNVENKELIIIKLIKKYQKNEYKEYYRKKVNKKISGRSKYNLDDVIIFSEGFECSPALLLFGVQ